MNYEIFELGDIQLQSGEILNQAKLAYKTYGVLNNTKDNVIVYPTSFSATHDDAAWLIGKGKALDTDKYFIVVPNAFGNGLSSSPSNTPAPQYGADFPCITLHDNVLQQYRLLIHKFDIQSIALAIGYSLGGSQAFEWAVLFPNLVKRLFTFQSAAKTSQHFYVFFDSVRSAIELDSGFKEGACTKIPEGGLKVAARIYAAWGFSQEFYRQRIYEISLGYDSIENFLVDFWENWLLKKDPYNLLAQLWTGQHADISANNLFQGDINKALATIKAETIIMPSSSDLYFPVLDAEREAEQISNAELRILKSDWGHLAGEGMNEQDSKIIDETIKELLLR